MNDLEINPTYGIEQYKLSYRACLDHLGAEGLGSRRGFDQLCHVLARRHDFRMTLQRLRVVGHTGATGRAERDYCGSKRPNESVHRVALGTGQMGHD